MNAGAEYLLYRIWATLQTERGIHAESLLTCVGALAGYACQQYVRDTWPLSRPDDLNAQLIESPLSLWSLVSRSVLKLEEPLPDLQEILRRTSAASETELTEVPQLPGWHRPHRPAIVYLKQLWPQTLPIVQRFCRRPLQMPVLFGIALQRAIEHTKDLLSPTLAASIAMECAVAMARVELPALEAPSRSGALGAVTGASTARISAGSSPLSTAPSGASTASAGATTPSAMPTLATITSAIALPAMRATPQRQTTKAIAKRQSAPSPAWALAKRIPPAAHIVAIGCLAFISTAGAMYKSSSNAPASAPSSIEATQAPRTLLAMASQSTNEPLTAPEEVAAPDIPGESQFPTTNSETEEESPVTAEESAPAPVLLADSSDVEPPPPPQIMPPDYDEGVMRDEWGQAVQ